MSSQILTRGNDARGMAWGLVLAWGAAVAIGSALGAMNDWPPFGIAGTVAAGIVLPALAYFFNGALRTSVEDAGLRSITAFHAWRIPAALTFYWYGAHNLLPATFVERAATGDLIAGVLAVAVAVWWPRRSGYWFFHVVGMADFLVAVGTGLSLTLAATPEMRNIVTFPVALIPLFGVGLSGASHIMAFDLLLRKKAR